MDNEFLKSDFKVAIEQYQCNAVFCVESLSLDHSDSRNRLDEAYCPRRIPENLSITCFEVFHLLFVDARQCRQVKSFSCRYRSDTNGLDGSIGMRSDCSTPLILEAS